MIVEDLYRKEVTVGEEKVMLEIIDTAGTEQFTSMVQLYIRNCQVCLRGQGLGFAVHGVCHLSFPNKLYDGEGSQQPNNGTIFSVGLHSRIRCEQKDDIR